MDGATNNQMADRDKSGGSNDASEQGTSRTATITPDLVREVTEKVYQLMLQDLKLQHERMGHSAVGLRYNGGRWC